jgi:hypothetical protein
MNERMKERKKEPTILYGARMNEWDLLDLLWMAPIIINILKFLTWISCNNVFEIFSKSKI